MSIKSMALINKQKYDPAQVQKLADLVRIYRDKGQPFDYEISVDGLKVVRRTDDPEMFFLFENFVTADTKAMEVIFYIGNSNVNEKRVFTFVDETEDKGLNGIEIEARIQDQLEKQKKEWQHDQLVQDNKKLKEEVEDLEKEVDRLEKAYEEISTNQSPLRGVIGEIGSSFLQSFIRNNPKVIQGLPGGEALMGLLNDNTNKQDQNPVGESEVSFKAKSSDTNSISEEDKAAITFVNQMKAQFSKDEFDKILLILQTLADDKSKIDLILNHVNIKQTT